MGPPHGRGLTPYDPGLSRRLWGPHAYPLATFEPWLAQADGFRLVRGCRESNPFRNRRSPAEILDFSTRKHAKTPGITRKVLMASTTTIELSTIKEDLCIANA